MRTKYTIFILIAFSFSVMHSHFGEIYIINNKSILFKLLKPIVYLLNIYTAQYYDARNCYRFICFSVF